MVGRPPVPLETRFWRFVSRGQNNECWPWTGAKDRNGYGFIKRRDGVQLRAHRVSFEMHHRRLADGELVCHRCDVPTCVNPNHLFAGTPADNTRDCMNKGRLPVHAGERNGASKLTAAQVTAIRADTDPQADIASKYGITQDHVSTLKLRKQWSHL